MHYRGWNALLPYFMKSEQFISPSPINHHGNSNITISHDSTVHGSSGPVEVSYPTFVPPQYTGFYDGLVSLRVPVSKDLSNGNNIGVSWTPSTQTDPSEVRVTSESAYRQFFPCLPSVVSDFKNTSISNSNRSET